MEVNPEEVIKHLSSEITRLNIELSFTKAALEQTTTQAVLLEKELIKLREEKDGE